MRRASMSFIALLLALPLPAVARAEAGAKAIASVVQQTRKEAGTEQVPLLRMEVRRVLVDVVVTDREGNPVRGLRKEDFVVKEDKKTQKVLSFDYLDGSAPSFVPPPLPALPVNTFINEPAEPERGPLYVLYYDMVNTMPDDQMSARRDLLAFLDKAQPGTRFALFVNAERLHLLQGFTSDHALLRNAITSKGPGPHIPAVFLYGENYGRQDVGAAVSNLQFLAEYLGGIAGRKNLIWLAGKFPVPHGPVYRPISGDDAMNQASGDVKNMFATMMRSQVAIYPVDVKGVVLWVERSPSPAGDAAPDISSTGNPNASTAGGAGGNGAGAAGSTTGSSSGTAAAMQGQTMGLSGYSVTFIDQQQEEYIATSTGGHAYYSDNRVALAMEKAVEQGESYYTLSYAPTNTKYDGSDRHIEVTLANKRGYTLTYRSLYYAVSDDAVQSLHKKEALQARFVAAKVADTLYANIEHGAPMLHDLLFSTHVAVSGAPALATPEQMLQLEESPAYFRTRHRDRPQKPLAPVKLQKYMIGYGIFDPQLKALAARGGKTATLEFAAAAYDADGRLLNSMLNDGLATAGDDEKGKSGALFHAEQELDVPPGAAWLRVAVRDKLNNRTGTLEVKLPLKPETATTANKVN
jgi:VWFA-related protein